MGNVTGQAASNLPGLKDLLQTDYVLPGYLNRDQATLVLLPTPQFTKPITLRVSFTHRFTNEAPTKPITVNLLPSKKVEIVIPIKDWPDGDYRTSIKEVRASREYGEEMVRWLRKQTIPPPAPPSEPVDLKGMTTFFLDDWYLKEKEGLCFKVHPAELFPITTGALEEGRIMQSGLDIRLDYDGAFVVSLRDKDRSEKNPKDYIARSEDGITWKITPEKTVSLQPELPGGEKIALTVSEVIYREYDSAVDGPIRLYDSAVDGPVSLNEVKIRYNFYQQKWGDIEVLSRSRYPVWNKSPQENVILSKPVTTDKWQHEEGDPGDWKDSGDNSGGQWLSKDNKTLIFSCMREIPRFPPFAVPYDNLPDHARILTVWKTNDGFNWIPTFFDLPTESDPISYQHYGNTPFSLEHKNLLLSYLLAYNQAAQQIYLELAYSRDGILWQRFPGQPAFALNGPFGSWNFGWMIPSPRSMVEKNGLVYELLGYCSSGAHFYGGYSGDGWPERSKLTPEWLKEKLEPMNISAWPCWKEAGSWEALTEDIRKASVTVGIMRYRKDGWVSITPEKEKGVLVTKTIKAGKTLSLNAKTNSGGSIKIEVFDDTGKPISDYSGDNAAVFSGDSTEFPLAWKDGTIKELPQPPIRLRITLDRANLYTLSW